MKPGTVLQVPDLPGDHSGLWGDNIILSLPTRALKTKCLCRSREQTLQPDLPSSCSSFNPDKHESGGLCTSFSSGCCRSKQPEQHLWLRGRSARSARWQMAPLWEQVLCWRAGMPCTGTSKSLLGLATAKSKGVRM